MVSYCAAFGCTNTKEKGSDITLYYFPSDNKLRAKWAHGSVFKLLYLVEKIVRQNTHALHTPKIEHIMLIKVLGEVNDTHIFPNLSIHSLETSDGADNHYLTLVRLISRKYLKLRIKKILRDRSLIKSRGNSLHRSRIV